MPKLFWSAAVAASSPRTRPVRTRVPARPTEPLEPRHLLSVALDAAGYTVVTPEHGDRAIYVSSSAGSDDNDGLSPDRPVRSLSAGADRLRDDSGDQLLLRRGDTWRGGLPGWRKSGASAERPMVIGAYGDGARPVVMPSASTAGFMTGLSSSPKIDHLVLQGISFAAARRDPSAADFDPAAVANNAYGIQLWAGGTDILIEDCAVADFSTDVAVQGGLGPLTNVRFRRNVVVDAYADDGTHAQGFFAHDVAGLLLEQNVFDHNGWSESPAVTALGAGAATVFNHDVYLTSSTSGVTVRGNVIARGAATGLQARSGGDVLDNLFVANPIHLDYGLVRGDSGPTPGGVHGTVNGNVFLGTRKLAGQVRGMGIEIANTKAGGPTVVSNNVFSNVGSADIDDNGPWDAGGFAALLLVVGQGKDDAAQAAGLRDLTLQGNLVRDWAAGLSLQSSMRPNAAGTDGYSGLVVKRNEFSGVRGTLVDHPAAIDGSAERWSGNRYNDGGDERVLKVEGRSLRADDGASVGAAGGTPAYADPDRSLASYMAATGGGDAASFLAGLRSMSKAAGTGPATSDGSTANRLSAAAAIGYVRAGFDDPAAGAAGRNWAPPTPPTAAADLSALAVRTDESAVTFAVTYRDDAAVNADSIDGNDVVLVAKGGRASPAELVNVTTADDGRTAVATYRAASPGPVWRTRDAGTYRVRVNENQVTDADGFAVDSGVVGEGTLAVTVVPPPPTVKKVKFVRGKRDLPDQLVVTLSIDLAGPPAATDLQLVPVTAAAPGTAADPSTPAPIPLDLSAAAVAYDPAKRALTWTFPAFPSGQLPAGAYAVTLQPTGVVSTGGKTLDGNADGLAGDAFVLAKPVKTKR